jgi:hypothetical protein
MRGGQWDAPATANYSSPCCRGFKADPGSYDIYEICGWEDDLSQLRIPTTRANGPTECQQQFATEAEPQGIQPQRIKAVPFAAVHQERGHGPEFSSWGEADRRDAVSSGGRHAD